MATAQQTIHIFVEVTKNDKRKLSFESDHVTGADIKAQAEVPPDSDLARRVSGQLELVKSDETIAIANGQHFVVLPPGTIS
jgi:hypothetical protein